MSRSLLVKPDLAPSATQVHRVTPESAGWRYVGFEVFDLSAGRALERRLAGREQCLVLLSGRAAVRIADQDLGTIGKRASPFEGKPFAAYAPAGATLEVTAASDCEVAIGSAPASGALPPRLIRPEEVAEEVRGIGTNQRYVRNILPATSPGECLQVVEVITPGGHWSSYPPHKHDSDQPGESQLEETYYHRLARPGGFAFQRVYTDDRTLDETMSVEDRDVVLVPRGYHPVSAAHGFDLYYLNVMAGPVRRWQVTQARGYEFLTPRR
ncbi:MAG: 5-deoxy-glucuronate isomerase [Gammaproteobacteria bacterium]|nr:5-deoxy-glucuronate isomerase [Gammaproteobacteria bacterium]MBV8405259.1 5-deoxy-glucuronate isomerase [Gammaproteobacteria bacterium]